MDIITKKKQFIDLISISVVNMVKFIKKDGTVRIMRFTTDLKRIPTKFHPKKSTVRRTVPISTSLIHVFDLDRGNWRSIPLNRVQWLEIGGKEKTKYRVKMEDIFDK